MIPNSKTIIFTDRSQSCVNTYLNEIRDSRPLTVDQEYRLWCRMCKGESQARQQLIEANLRYVITVAKPYHQTYRVPLEDLIQAGNEGLVKAVDRFDASRGYKLITFARWYVENEIRQVVCEHRRHSHTSLDEPCYKEDSHATARIERYLPSGSASPDWDLLRDDLLRHIYQHAEQRMAGIGEMAVDYYLMRVAGYSKAEFARRHHLSRRQLSILLDKFGEHAILKPLSSCRHPFTTPPAAA